MTTFNQYEKHLSSQNSYVDELKIQVYESYCKHALLCKKPKACQLAGTTGHKIDKFITENNLRSPYSRGYNRRRAHVDKVAPKKVVKNIKGGLVIDQSAHDFVINTTI